MTRHIWKLQTKESGVRRVSVCVKCGTVKTDVKRINGEWRTTYVEGYTAKARAEAEECRVDGRTSRQGRD